MENKIRDIVATFLKIPPGEINLATVIDRSAVSSSILLHRMYAKLAAEGILIDQYQNIRNFGDLVARVSPVDHRTVPSDDFPGADIDIETYQREQARGENEVGIDIEQVAAMPQATDFREDTFYTNNFSQSEIAYCILQHEPYTSFAGLFAAKEAIVKADNRFAGVPFHRIVIDHLPGGKPAYHGFRISISHTDRYAVGVAIKEKGDTLPSPGSMAETDGTRDGTQSLPMFLILFSILLSLFAIVMALKR